MSGLRSQPLDERPRKASAIVTRSQLARSRGVFEQVSAAGILVASYVGTVFSMAGGVGALMDDPLRLWPWVSALLAQGVLTALQWWYGSVSRWHPFYLAALAVDTALTTWGFAPLAVPPFAAWLGGFELTEAVFGGWLLLAVIALGCAWYPESRFVD